MLEWLRTTVGVSISGGLLLAFLGFLAKNWFLERLKNSLKHEYDRELETHKANLSRVNERELMEFKHKLELAASERNVRYSKIFDRTADTIATTYQKLLELKNAVSELFGYSRKSHALGEKFTLRTEEAENEIFEKVAKTWKDLHLYFEPNKIYVPKRTAKAIQGFSDTLTGVMVQYSIATEAQKHSSNRGDIINQFDELESSYESIPSLLNALEDDFQRILGFPIEASRSTTV